MQDYFSMFERDKLFGASANAYEHRWTGMSEANPEYESRDVEKATRWAMYSALTSEVATATLMVLPDWGASGTAYLKYPKNYPYRCVKLQRSRGYGSLS